MNHRKIKKHLYGWLLASALLAAGCGQEEDITETPSDPANPAETSNVILNFTVAGELSTRTDLSGSDNVQHVTSVRLYIFDGTGRQCPLSSLRRHRLAGLFRQSGTHRHLHHALSRKVHRTGKRLSLHLPSHRLGRPFRQHLRTSPQPSKSALPCSHKPSPPSQAAKPPHGLPCANPNCSQEPPC